MAALAGGKPRNYEINVREGQVVRLLLDKGDLDMTLTLSTPDSRKLGEFTSRSYGALPLMFVADSSGTYGIELRSLERDTVERPFALKIAEVRDSTERDRAEESAQLSFAEAERLRSDWREDSLRKALERYTEAWKRWQSASRVREASRAMESVGDTYFILGEYRQALDAFQSALKASREGGDKSVELSALNNVGYAYVFLGENRKATQCFKKVFDILRRARQSMAASEADRHEARVLNNRGEVNYALGDLKEALNNFNRALTLWSQVPDRRGLALAHLNLGYTYSDSGDLPKAKENFGQALTLAREVDDRRLEALSLTALGTVHAFLGEQQQALDSHGEALALFRAIGDRQGTGIALNSIGQAYEDLNEPQVALDNYLLALDYYQRNGNRDSAAVTGYYIGRVYHTLGDDENAIAYYENSIRLCQEMGKRRAAAYAQIEAATIRGLHGDRQKALAQYGRVRKLFQEIADSRGEALTLNSIGYTYQALGDLRRALSFYTRALPLSRAASDRSGEASTLYNIARAQRERGLFNEAALNVEESIRITESLRTSVINQELRTSYFASVHERYGFYIDLLMQMHKLSPGAGFADTALHVSERARARSLLELLNEAHADIRQSLDSDLLEREHTLQELLASKAEYQMRLLSNNRAAREASEVEREIRQLTSAYQEVRTRIKEQNPRYATLTQPSPLRPEEIQAELQGEDTLLLEFVLGDERSYLWAVTSGSIHSYELPKRAEIEEAARDFYRLLTARLPKPDESYAAYQARVAIADRDYWQVALRLSQMIFGQLTAELSSKRLLIVADGALQYVPFDALPDPLISPAPVESGASLATDMEPLVLRHEVVNLPSASALSLLRLTRGHVELSSDRIALVLADPVFGKDDPRVSANPVAVADGSCDKAETGEMIAARDSAGLREGESFARLPATFEEAQAIKAATGGETVKIVTGFAARRELVIKGDIGQYRVLHFATHGLVNSLHPELSGILLSTTNERGQPENGFLQLHDIYNLKLSSQLVVLSACNTGLGKEIKGEGLIGLTQGFMYAGAKGVVASFWKVDDKATAELMRYFYEAMLGEGLPPATALQKAKVKMWSQKRWRAPYYWAAFTLQGEYRESIMPARATNKGAARPILLLVLLTLPIMAFYAFRRWFSTPRRRHI
jgi:CHAT domain-containing protein/tetratricopeptide (TPR) repeat protein